MALATGQEGSGWQGALCLLCRWASAHTPRIAGRRPKFEIAATYDKMRQLTPVTQDILSIMR